MTWGIVASAGASIVGGMMSGNAAEDAANQQAQMSAEQAAALKEASKWKAIGTTNRFGASEQVTDGAGTLIGAQWNMSPEMKAYQERLMKGVNGAMPTDFDPAKATEAQYQLLKNQQAPGVERGYSGLLSNLVNKGTLGLSTGGTEGLGGSASMRQSNPQLEAFFNAIAQQDASNLTTAQSSVRSMMDSDINRSNALFKQSTNVDDRGDASLDRTIKWGADQRDAAMRGAGAAATQSNLAGSQMADANSGSMFGSLLQGIGSSPNLGSSIGGMFGTKVSPTGDMRSRADIINGFQW